MKRSFDTNSRRYTISSGSKGVVTLTHNVQDGSLVKEGAFHIDSMSIPQQYRQSSAEATLSLRLPDSVKTTIVDPQLTGTFFGVNSSITFLEDADFEISQGGTPVELIEQAADGDNMEATPYYILGPEVTDSYYTEARVGKYCSEAEAIDRVNQALFSSYVNHHNTSDHIYLKQLLDEYIDVSLDTEDTGRYMCTFEFIVYNNGNETTTANIEVAFRAKDDDKTGTNFQLGNLTYRPGLTRVCPYDVLEDIEQTTASMSEEEAAKVSRAYHATKERLRPGFQRCLMKAEMRNHVFDAAKLITSLPSGWKVGIVVVPYHHGTVDSFGEGSDYDAIVPHVQKRGDLLYYNQDARDMSRILHLSPVMEHRLQLLPTFEIGTFVRSKGRVTNENKASEGETPIYASVTEDRHLMKGSYYRSGRCKPLLNEVKDISVNLGLDNLRVDNKRSKTGGRTNLLHSTKPAEGFASTESYKGWNQAVKHDQNNNTFNIQFYCSLHNPLQPSLNEVVDAESCLSGDVYSHASIDFTMT
jgi:hypothetical protein